MVSKKIVREQLKNIGFKHNGWGRAEVSELPRIILPNEEIYECVNGYYEGGFALLVATDVRVLLIDKKPLNYLTVEDMRFDMISEMDYSHRIIGADINISSGGKILHFRSYNQHRLRKLIGHVQHCMAEVKKKQTNHQDSQVSHLEQINRQLQSYLVAQQQYQLQVQGMNNTNQPSANVTSTQVPEPPKPSHELADYLYAQRLLDKHNQEASDKLETETGSDINLEPVVQPIDNSQIVEDPSLQIPKSEPSIDNDNQLNDIYNEGVKEIFGNQKIYSDTETVVSEQPTPVNVNLKRPVNILSYADTKKLNILKTFDLNPLHIAFSKLPFALRLRKFGRPAIQARTKQVNPTPTHAYVNR